MAEEDKGGSAESMSEHVKVAVDLWKYHSQTMWSRIQTLGVIEGATLAGWYQIRIGWDKASGVLSSPGRSLLALGALSLGSYLVLLVLRMIRRDSDYIRSCLRVAGSFVPEARNSASPFLSPKPGCFIPVPDETGLGRKLAQQGPKVLIAFNIALAVWTLASSTW